MELDSVQIRILGCLVEKQTTTPDNYPLSTNALLNACNQSSNRDPVVRYDSRTVTEAMLTLRAEGLARTVTGGRADKHRHVLDEAWSLSPGQLAVLAVLFLRGPQTVGELKTRTERMHGFQDIDAVERVLHELADADDPYVTLNERLPGQKERRWDHLCRDGESQIGRHSLDQRADHTVGGESDHQSSGQSASGRSTRIEAPAAERPRAGTDLEAEVRRLRADVDRLYELLGEAPPTT